MLGREAVELSTTKSFFGVFRRRWSVFKSSSVLGADILTKLRVKRRVCLPQIAQISSFWSGPSERPGWIYGMVQVAPDNAVFATGYIPTIIAEVAVILASRVVVKGVQVIVVILTFEFHDALVLVEEPARLLLLAKNAVLEWVFVNDPVR